MRGSVKVLRRSLTKIKKTEVVLRRRRSRRINKKRKKRKLNCRVQKRMLKNRKAEATVV